MIDKLVGATIGVVVGLVMLPVVVDIVEDLDTSTYTGVFGTGVDSLVSILPLLYVVIIVGGAVAYVKWK